MNNRKNTRSFRIFISSTFRDMEEERSYIIEQVIPAFKKKADEHGVDVSVIDLRWGITEEESRSGKVLEICLRHIDNCRPLFIGIVGDRYGWCPSPEDFTDNEDLKSNFPEIEDYFNEGLSITEIEMQYGAINSKKETDAIFFLRNSERGHFLRNEETDKVDSLRKKIQEDDTLLSYCYYKNELRSLELKKWEFGGKLLEWLNSELLKYYPEKGVMNEEEPIILNNRDERKEYLLQVLSENGKTLSPEHVETILDSPHTLDAAGLDNFINDLLLYGVFQELNEFINWRTTVTNHDYEEFFIRRQLKIYSTAMINVIRALALSRRGLDNSILTIIFYHYTPYRPTDNEWKSFMKDLKKNRFIDEYPYKDITLYTINKEHENLIFDLLLPDEDAIERGRVMLIEALLGEFLLSDALQEIEDECNVNLSACNESLNDFIDSLDLDEIFENSWIYPELLYQKSLTPSLDYYDDNSDLLENCVLKGLMGGYIPESVEEGTDEYYRLQHAKILMYGRIYCTFNELKLLEVIQDMVSFWLNNPISQNIISEKEYYRLRFDLDESLSTLRSSDDEYVMERGISLQSYIFDDSELDEFDYNIWYEGELDSDLKPHGKGKSHERNGNTYEGYWMHGKKHGYGIYESSGKYIYEGDYQYDIRHGKGTLIYLDDAEDHYMGDRYEGDFKNNKFEGYGKYQFADGNIYEGEFHKSSLEGYGVLTFGDGYRYEGQFKNYLFHGRGVLYYNDGRWFEGMFENDEMNGEGVLHLPNDAVITGTWKDGERVGLFTLTLPNGETRQRMY